jgi:uncharacterized protein (TIGR02996 family)
MPRYELSEGTSNKFWEIKLSGTSFTTTYGKIGSNGQTTIKTFGSDADAKKEHDKLVAEKVKKGYTAVGGKVAKAAPAAAAKTAKAAKPAAKGAAKAAKPAADQPKGDARNPDLEKAILANPGDRDAYAVFGDWLQEQGDPRGELIALQLGNRDKAGKQLIEKHADYFLGPLAEHQKTRDGLSNNSRSHLRTSAQEKEWQKTGEQAFLWRNGYIHRVRLSHDVYFEADWKGKTVDVLDLVLKHPSGRYVVEFSFQTNGDPSDGNLQDIIDLLGKKAPATTRKITFGDNVDQISWHHTGNLSKLWKGVPNLRVLEIETGDFNVGKREAPALERGVFITGGLGKACAKGIATATMPKIKHLEIYYGVDEYGGDSTIKEVKPLLDRTDLKDLRYLGIKNSTFANDIAGALDGAKVLKGIKTLDLSYSTMTDEGANALAAAKSSLAHLDVLDLTHNYLSKAGVKTVQGICKKVITAQQQESDDGEYYYVGIAE